MNKLSTLFLTLVICASLVPRLSYCAEEGNPQADEKLAAFKPLYTLASLREIGVQNSADAVKGFFSPRAELRWKRIAQEFSEEQLNDFFLGSILLAEKDVNYSALYNPFWDTILLLNSAGTEEIPKVEKFAFVSGCKFRGEPYSEKLEEMEGTIPKANPYCVDLWAVTSRTQKHFKTVYAPEAEARLTQFIPTDLADTERIQYRSAVRLKLLLKFIQNKPMRREARRISLYLSSGNEERALSYFKDGGAGFIPNFLRLDSELRQHFVPYCFFPGKEATLFVFFNSTMPRVIVTVTIPRKGMTKILEWYDLMASEELMAVWNQSKEVK